MEFTPQALRVRNLQVSEGKRRNVTNPHKGWYPNLRAHYLKAKKRRNSKIFEHMGKTQDLACIH